MINSDSATSEGNANAQQNADVNAILRSGGRGAVVVAGLATAIVVVIWFMFYLLVFVPRAVAP
jgi:hypothetical protein